MNEVMIEQIRIAPQKNLFDYMGNVVGNSFFPTLREGLILEFGVHVGNTLKVISSCTNRPVFGFDSFEGLPEYWSGAGGLPAGTFACDPPMGLKENVVLIKGWFENTVPPFCNIFKSLNKVSLMHIDCDVGSGATTVLNNFQEVDMFQDGTIIIFDEIMGYPGWEEGEFQSFNNFLDTSGYKWECIGRHGGDPENILTGGEVKAAFRIFN